METESKGNILVIDDSPANLGVLFNYLNQAGFTVALVQNSENALKQAEANLPDLILLDVMMPDLDGFEVCSRLKANEATRAIPVIFMTALSETVDKVRGFHVGGVDYITKPLQCEEVLARVQTHLTIQRLQQELQEKNAALAEYVTLLTEQKTQLKELNASKDRFFSIIAHDLRSPFTGLLGVTRMVAENFETYPPSELKNTMLKLRDGCEHLYALLENLLTWARLQQGLVAPHPQDINLRLLILHSVALFTPNAEHKQIVLQRALQEQVTAYADEKMVETILRNLLSNALKFTRPGGRITVTATQDASTATVAVADTGIGIDQEYLPQLFRLDASYKRAGTANERGSGLGLILCKEFVTKNGGEIWVESEVEHGATFRFTLPKKPEPAVV